jgi:hypothetical protein
MLYVTGPGHGGPGLVANTWLEGSYTKVTRRRHRRHGGLQRAAQRQRGRPESFFATLKKELVHRRSWPPRRELISEVSVYVEAFTAESTPCPAKRAPHQRRMEQTASTRATTFAAA